MYQVYPEFITNPSLGQFKLFKYPNGQIQINGQYVLYQRQNVFIWYNIYTNHLMPYYPNNLQVPRQYPHPVQSAPVPQVLGQQPQSAPVPQVQEKKVIGTQLVKGQEKVQQVPEFKENKKKTFKKPRSVKKKSDNKNPNFCGYEALSTQPPECHECPELEDLSKL